jgi:hypothetical protein
MMAVGRRTRAPRSRGHASRQDGWPQLERQRGVRRQVESDTPAGRVGLRSSRLPHEAVGRRLVKKEIAATLLTPRRQTEEDAPQQSRRPTTRHCAFTAARCSGSRPSTEIR